MCGSIQVCEQAWDRKSQAEEGNQDPPLSSSSASGESIWHPFCPPSDIFTRDQTLHLTDLIWQHLESGGELGNEIFCGALTAELARSRKKLQWMDTASLLSTKFHKQFHSKK